MTHKPESSDTIGQILRRARLQGDRSVHEVSRALRLPRTVIESIEADRLDDLAPIYRRGYVLNYARQVGADLPRIRELLDIHDDQPPELQQVLPTGQFAWRFESLMRGATYVLVSTVIVLPLVWFFVEGGARMFESGEAEVTRGLSAAQTEETPRRVSQRIADALALEEDGEGDDSPAHLSASTMPLNVLKQPREARGDESTPDAPLLIDTDLIEPADADVPGPVNGRELVVFLEEESWAEIRDATGNRLEYDLLATGRHVYRGQPPFDILLGKAGAAVIEIDGRAAQMDGFRDVDLARFQVLADGRIED